MSNEKHVALYYREGTSDKEYHVHLVQQGQGYVVRIEYGRRGNALTSVTKTPVPVDLDKASAIFDKQVREKKLKGYTEGAGQTPYVGTAKEDKITGVLPQLLNLIEEEDLDDYFDDPNFCMQEKKDGRRILLRKPFGFDAEVEAINRKGLLVGFPQCIQDLLGLYQEAFTIDGEMIGETFWAFDLLDLGGEDFRQKGYQERYKQLVAQKFDEPCDACPHPAIQIVLSYKTLAAKRTAFKQLRAKGAEGVVFKKVDALYKPGRPASGGDQLKFKFTQTCTCRVSGINEKGKRSVYIEMLDGKKPVSVGKVTILPNFPVPEVDSLAEVKYLYRHVHGALYQPIYLGQRDDLDQADQVSTLKVKEGIDVDEEEA